MMSPPENDAPADKDQFCFQLEVPAALIALHAVQSLVTEAARLSGFVEDEQNRFALIAEEGFVHTIRQLQLEGDEFTVRVMTRADSSTFTVSFFDRGSPLVGEPGGNDSDQLELMLIKVYCHEMKWVGHGKQGKELRILFRRPMKDITQYELPPVAARSEGPGEVEIERLPPEDADRIPRLVYRTYGYSYPNDDLYYPDRVKHLLESGDLVSIVARDKKNNEIAGHYAIEVYGRTRTAEVGQAAVVNDYRGMGILERMRKRIEKEARVIGLGGFYGQSVTSHTATQRINEKFGAVACGISFGLVPKLNFRKMNLQPLTQRETCFYYFKNLEKRTERILYLPDRHREIIGKIYREVGLPFHLGTSSAGTLSAAGRISEHYHATWGFGVIDVAGVGSDFAAAFAAAFNRLRLVARADVIFLTLPLEESGLEQAAALVEERRFFFCGVAPYHFDGRDGLRFEYVNTLIDTEKIKVFSDFGREVSGYCAERMHEAMA